MDQNNDQKLKQFLDNLEQGKLEYTDKAGVKRTLIELETWTTFENKQKELLTHIENVTHAKHQKQQRRILAFTSVTFICLLLTLYLYFDKLTATQSFSILPGKIQELKLPNGTIWINGNTTLDIQQDSVIILDQGEFYLSKSTPKQHYSIITPNTKQIILVQGSINIITHAKTDRVTSLGTVNITTDKDTINLPYATEYRTSPSKNYIQELQSPSYIGGFRTGKLAFENESTEFIISQLATFYNIQINYTKLPSTSLTLIVQKTDDPMVTLKKIIPDSWTVTSNPGHTVYTITALTD